MPRDWSLVTRVITEHGASRIPGNLLITQWCGNAGEEQLKLTGIEGLLFKDLRHTWKTNAQRSGMHPAIADAIVGHRSALAVEDRYIRVSDEDLFKAVDSMSFDHGVT